MAGTCHVAVSGMGVSENDKTSIFCLKCFQQEIIVRASVTLTPNDIAVIVHFPKPNVRSVWTVGRVVQCAIVPSAAFQVTAVAIGLTSKQIPVIQFDDIDKTTILLPFWGRVRASVALMPLYFARLAQLYQGGIRHYFWTTYVPFPIGFVLHTHIIAPVRGLLDSENAFIKGL